MSFMGKYWAKYKLLFISSVICVALEAACDLIQPQILARLIDDGVGKLDMQYVLSSGLLMLSVAGLGAVFACSRNYLSSKASQNFGADMRKDLFVKVLDLPVSESDRFDGGSLVTRLTNDVTQLTNFVNGLMRIIVKAPITCIGCIILAIRINIHTTPIVIGIVVVAVLSFAFSMRLSYPAFARVQQGIDRLNTTVREYLMGIRLVKAFGRSAYEEQRFRETNESLTVASTKATRIINFFSPITNFIAHMGVVLILVIGYGLVQEDKMHVGQIMAFISYMTQILVSLSMISNILNIFVRTRASYIRIAEVMEIDKYEDNDADDGAEDLTFDENKVVFQDISFQYPQATGDIALQNISFTIKRGETLGIIGPTGSGKSTLASLILGFYTATVGQILIGGKAIQSIPTQVLRRHIAYVPQIPTLFTGTIKENIMWGKEDASLEQVEHAAKTAEAYDFIQAAEKGFETILGQGGINLSGGQKQRVSIARALVGDPQLLILDDCTSALDSITEYRVQRGLKAYSENLSCVLITQRISSAMKADKILVLDNGKQAGFGTHGELIDSCPVYKEIYDSQIGRENRDE